MAKSLDLQKRYYGKISGQILSQIEEAICYLALDIDKLKFDEMP